MQLTPRYGDRPIISVDIRSAAHPVMGQRRRLEGLLGDLSEEEWQRPSRCAGWTVQDVVAHLITTNTFWAVSIQAGLAGEPTRFLAEFDPVATPAELVAAGRGTSVGDTLAQLTAGHDALAAVIDALDGPDWDTLAEAPPGHLPIHLVADHALWDSWVHERDIVLALGRTPVVDPDEVIVSLHYCAALGPAFTLFLGSADRGSAEVIVSDPSHRFVVSVEDDLVRVHDGGAPEGTPVLRADAASLVDALSIRAELPDAPVLQWLTAGLAEVFDQTTAR